ncbi:MAG: hypothetical protein RBR06_07585 [Desulfuromonadaceae bacterium]|nr:hypothetical protein [Desulfuromonadaceae bacterium]
MKSMLYRIATFSLSAFALAACVSTGPNKAPEISATPISIEAITYNVPNSEGVIRSGGLIKDLSFPSMSRFIGTGHYERLLYQDKTPSTFVVHRRVDNGTAGSGIKYTVGYTVTDSNSGYSVSLKPQEYITYQQGLIGKFPIPNYGVSDLRNTLASSTLYYKFDIDSPYSSESVYANFLRLVKHVSFRPGEKDPVTGKIFKDRFVLTSRNNEVRFVIEAYPYRNGSKVIVSAAIPGAETSQNVIDFGVLIREIEQKLLEVVKA